MGYSAADRSRHGASGPAVFAVVGLAYAAGSGLASWLLHPSLGAVFFPPAGITLAALVLTRRSRWPWVLAAAGLAEFCSDLMEGNAAGTALGFTLANTAEPLIGATLLCRSVPRPNLALRADLVRFVGSAVTAGPVVGALIGTATALLTVEAATVGRFAPYWAGNALGVLTVGGTILTWKLAGSWSHRDTWLAYFGTLIVSGLVTTLAFWSRAVPMEYLIFPMLFLVALYRGVASVTAAGLAATLVANMLTANDHGPWATIGRTESEVLATLQLLLGVAVLSAWILAVEVRARERAQSRSAAELALRRRLEAFQAVTEQLATAATSEQIADIVRREGIPLVSPTGMVGVVSRDGTELHSWPTADFPPDLAAECTPLSLDSREQVNPLTLAVRSRQPVMLSSVDDLGRRLPSALLTQLHTGARGLLQIPAMVGNHVLGVLAFGLSVDGTTDADLLASAHALTQLTAQALDRAQLYERDHEAAHQLQRALLPASRFDLPGIQVAAVYRPSEDSHEVGGDWYDAFALSNGRIGFTVGDVVGHDLAAAVTMGRLQAALRLVATTSDGPAEVLRQLDTAAVTIPGALLTTVGYGEYDPASRHLRYACAGHLPPLLSTSDGYHYLQGGRSTPLGIHVRPRIEASLFLPPASSLFWCTDGLVERRGEDIDVGLDRFAGAVNRLSDEDPQASCERVMGELINSPQGDDAVVLCLRTALDAGTIVR